MHSTKHGRAADLFDPAVHRAVMGTPRPNPGAPGQWNLRPRWHGVVYGNGREAPGDASVIGTGDRVAWPIVQDDEGLIGRAPKGSRFAKVTKDELERFMSDEPATKTRRRKSVAAEVLELHARGSSPETIAETLDIKESRVLDLIDATVRRG